jgi:hypothetical protein
MPIIISHGSPPSLLPLKLCNLNLAGDYAYLATPLDSFGQGLNVIPNVSLNAS